MSNSTLAAGNDPVAEDLAPATEGWFVVNVRDGRWMTNEVLGEAFIIEGDDAGAKTTVKEVNKDVRAALDRTLIFLESPRTPVARPTALCRFLSL